MIAIPGWHKRCKQYNNDDDSPRHISAASIPYPSPIAQDLRAGGPRGPPGKINTHMTSQIYTTIHECHPRLETTGEYAVKTRLVAYSRSMSPRHISAASTPYPSPKAQDLRAGGPRGPLGKINAHFAASLLAKLRMRRTPTLEGVCH